MILQKRIELLKTELSLLKSKKKDTRTKAQIFDITNRINRIRRWISESKNYSVFKSN